MCCLIASILIAREARAPKQDFVDDFVDKLVDKLVSSSSVSDLVAWARKASFAGRAPLDTASYVDHAPLDKATLGKPDHLAISLRPQKSKTTRTLHASADCEELLLVRSFWVAPVRQLSTGRPQEREAVIDQIQEARQQWARRWVAKGSSTVVRASTDDRASPNDGASAKPPAAELAAPGGSSNVSTFSEDMGKVVSLDGVSSKLPVGSAPRQEMLPGYRVKLPDGRRGEVEFVATSGEVLLSLDTHGRPARRPRFEETPREWVEGMWPQQVWVPVKDVQVESRRQQLRERRDVADYRHAMRCLQGLSAGISAVSLAEELGRPEEWVVNAWQRGPPAKPKHLEHWDSQGFCEVRYLKGRYHQPGLYESIVQGVDWQQDKVWRVHKEPDGTWDLRTIKQCEADGCGRSLQRVPESAVKIGPKDSDAPTAASPHSDWVCAKLLDSCAKATQQTPLRQNFYWWCPKHKWYVCHKCKEHLPDKPTSKQIRGWYRGECSKLDELVYKVVSDFNLPDPQAPYGGTAQYAIKMNWYPDGMAQVTDHRHDIWTVLISLGAPRVLNVDYARVLMEDGDAILFGTQKHGVPAFPPSHGGRLSLVLMFQPDKQVEKAALHLAGREVPDLVPRTVGQEHQAEWDTEDRLPQWGEEEIAALSTMGFSAAEAEQALAACDGDSNAAANLLLNSNLNR